MAWENELNDRKKNILKSIIDVYIQSAQPVGSRTIARKHDLGLGSATIRNEMADLEELGYITQPHTSAGRVPSDKGYRFYVDHLMQAYQLAQEEILQIRQAMEDRVEELNQLFKKACSIISSFTGYPTIVMSPQLSGTLIKSVQVVAIDDKHLLVVLVVEGGIVRNKMVRHNEMVDEGSLVRLTNVLNTRLAGKKLCNATVPLAADLTIVTHLPETLLTLVLDAVQECIRRIENIDVYLDGVTNLLNFPEFSDLLKAREVLELLHGQDVINTLVKRALNERKLQVRIGSENEIDPLKELSVVTTVYGHEGRSTGAISIIGPTRMTYGKVVSSILYIKELIDKEIMRIFDEEE
ncbi:heat-inducible transcriptional repressor HrcA [Thermoclostridium caenicola]|uniref:Heat-inducible transcription repressor HrcA n=1 Tax=Thermoclostridium caenicola TaxID=659425 RepID=A0A1M6B9W1_9FIRM|nr:heat-inducible transcriptional repressor HrcA [Thermoclostridium caenicola]SHI45534.1 heat-inducible transcription repressor HrcA [Thermoclostridium caenicola]